MTSTTKAQNPCPRWANDDMVTLLVAGTALLLTLCLVAMLIASLAASACDSSAVWPELMTNPPSE